ncbi:hypothetical protein F2Q70_00005011 [Brassica cretica]|uniref:Uncharacterized protein n=1 Tax=Brassica cretica TaxID=69181 RepID=A0A8S9IKH9_BRACR|nr:hypothetical protein F2Q70_00005011 [Brassica cretica]
MGFEDGFSSRYVQFHSRFRISVWCVFSPSTVLPSRLVLCEMMGKSPRGVWLQGRTFSIKDLRSWVCGYVAFQLCIGD